MDEPEQTPTPHDPYGDQPTAEYARPEGRSRRTWMVAAAIGVVVLAVGGFFGVKALAGGGSSSTSTAGQAPAGNGQGRGAGRGTVGTLQSIDGSTLTVATFGRGGNNGANSGGGTTTVVTGGSTKFYKTVSGALSDIKVGDRVTANGTPDGTTALTAARITDTGTMNALGGPAGGPGGGGRRANANGNGNGNGNGTPPSTAPGATRPDPNSFANGTVKSISGTTLTVADNNGATKTVNTNGTTAISVLKTVSINDLQTGQAIVVRGTTNSDGTVTATDVVQGIGGFGRGGGAGGRFGGGGDGGGGQAPGTGATPQ
jgi:hypothetical protein